MAQSQGNDYYHDKINALGCEKEVISVESCELPTPGMFDKAIHLHLGMGEHTFEEARHAAYASANTYSTDPMLLSWFDKKSGTYSPNIVECCRRGEPSWVTYAHSRGGDLAIDINDGEYVFLFRGKESLS
jgi:hypothetical protein